MTSRCIYDRQTRGLRVAAHGRDWGTGRRRDPAAPPLQPLDPQGRGYTPTRAGTCSSLRIDSAMPLAPSGRECKVRCATWGRHDACAHEACRNRSTTRPRNCGDVSPLCSSLRLEHKNSDSCQGRPSSPLSPLTPPPPSHSPSLCPLALVGRRHRLVMQQLLERPCSMAQWSRISRATLLEHSP